MNQLKRLLPVQLCGQFCDSFLPGDLAPPASTAELGQFARPGRDCDKVRNDAERAGAFGDGLSCFGCGDELDLETMRRLLCPSPAEPMLAAALRVAGVG